MIKRVVDLNIKIFKFSIGEKYIMTSIKTNEKLQQKLQHIFQVKGQ